MAEASVIRRKHAKQQQITDMSRPGLCANVFWPGYAKKRFSGSG